MMSVCEAKLVPMTPTSGYATARTTTTTATAFAVRPMRVGRSIHGGRPSDLRTGAGAGAGVVVRAVARVFSAVSTAVHPFVAESVGELVGAQHECGADDRLDESDGGGDAPVVVLDAVVVDVGVEHL